MAWNPALLISFMLIFSIGSILTIENPENEARRYIREFEEKYWPQAEQVQQFLMIDFKNLTDENIQSGDLATFSVRNFTLELAQKLRRLPVDNLTNIILKRQVKKILKLNDWILDDKDLSRKISFQAHVNKIIKYPGLCSYRNRTKCDLAFDPNIRDIIVESDDPKELEYYWVAWRDYLDDHISIPLEEYLKIIRKVATLNGFATPSTYWYADFENGNIIEEIESLIHQMEPFYKQLHAYMRSILRKRYGSLTVTANGPIPDHLLEKIWLEGMETFQFYEDFNQNSSLINVGEKLVEQGYTGMKLVRTSEAFYKSLGMTELECKFWTNNVHPVVETKSSLYCRPVVYDFGHLAGLKYCSKVNFRTFLEAHAIMAKIQYHEHAKHLPYGLNVEACPGLWKVVGKAIKLSASSSDHLREMNLIPEMANDSEGNIHALLNMAVHTVFKFPTYYVYEKFFSDSLDKKIDPEDYNCIYWRLLEARSGIEAPTQRDDDDFDVSRQFYKVTQSSMPLATKLLSEFLGFHLYKRICTKIGKYDPNSSNGTLLKDCNFYNSREAGKLLEDIMSLGWTKPCFDVIEIFTKSRNLMANAMLEYFKPLHQWLEEQNKQNKEYIGWIPSNKCQKAD